MQKYKVLKDIEVTDQQDPLFGSHAPGAVLECEPQSVLSLLEEGFLELIEDVVNTDLNGDGQVGQPENKPEESEPAAPSAPAPVVPSPAVEHKSDLVTPPAPFENVLPLVYAFCMAIQNHEGYFTPGEHADYPNGSPAFVNKNPGNIKFHNQAKAIGETRNSFAIFATYEDGFEALVHQVTIACNGRSQAYRPDMTIMAFFKVYASSKGDEPEIYAAEVAKAVGLTVDTPISTLIS